MKKFIFVILLVLSFNLQASELYFVDAHSQVDHNMGDMSVILARMKENGVRQTILAARGKRPSSDVVNFAQEYPAKVLASIRTKGGAYKKNKKKYYKKLTKRYQSGSYSAIAEVILYHAQKGDKADEVDILPDDERAQAALDVALDAGWPFVFHVEFAAINGDKRKEYWDAMETMLQANQQHPFVIIHMGQLDARDVEQLIITHKNLYFMTSHADHVTTRDSSQPWVNMFEGKQFKTKWKRLLSEHKERFVFALDNVWAEHWLNTYTEKVTLWRNALNQLPDDVAHAVAHGNAEKLWGIK